MSGSQPRSLALRIIVLPDRFCSSGSQGCEHFVGELTLRKGTALGGSVLVSPGSLSLRVSVCLRSAGENEDGPRAAS